MTLLRKNSKNNEEKDKYLEFKLATVIRDKEEKKFQLALHLIRKILIYLDQLTTI